VVIAKVMVIDIEIVDVVGNTFVLVGTANLGKRYNVAFFPLINFGKVAIDALFSGKFWDSSLEGFASIFFKKQSVFDYVLSDVSKQMARSYNIQVKHQDKAQNIAQHFFQLQYS
jgi:lipopolysaccharide biosynthesis glycosyltransferase